MMDPSLRKLLIINIANTHKHDIHKVQHDMFPCTPFNSPVNSPTARHRQANRRTVHQVISEVALKLQKLQQLPPELCGLKPKFLMQHYPSVPSLSLKSSASLVCRPRTMRAFIMHPDGRVETRNHPLCKDEADIIVHGEARTFALTSVKDLVTTMELLWNPEADPTDGASMWTCILSMVGLCSTQDRVYGPCILQISTPTNATPIESPARTPAFPEHFRAVFRREGRAIKTLYKTRANYGACAEYAVSKCKPLHLI